MIGYEIYLSRSAKVTGLIATSLAKEVKEGVSISWGKVWDQEFIPPMYHNSGYFFVYMKRNDLDHPLYRLIFA